MCIVFPRLASASGFTSYPKQSRRVCTWRVRSLRSSARINRLFNPCSSVLHPWLKTHRAQQFSTCSHVAFAR